MPDWVFLSLCTVEPFVGLQGSSRVDTALLPPTLLPHNLGRRESRAELPHFSDGESKAQEGQPPAQSGKSERFLTRQPRFHGADLDGIRHLAYQLWPRWDQGRRNLVTLSELSLSSLWC